MVFLCLSISIKLFGSDCKGPLWRSHGSRWQNRGPEQWSRAAVGINGPVQRHCGRRWFNERKQSFWLCRTCFVHLFFFTIPNKMTQIRNNQLIFLFFFFVLFPLFWGLTKQISLGWRLWLKILKMHRKVMFNLAVLLNTGNLGKFPSWKLNTSQATASLFLYCFKLGGGDHNHQSNKQHGQL